MGTRHRFRKHGDNIVSAADQRTLGVRARDGDSHAAEMAALDSLPPLLRQYLNESVFKWSAVTVENALNIHRANNPGMSAEKAAVDIVLWFDGQEQRMIAAAEAERTRENKGLHPA